MHKHFNTACTMFMSKKYLFFSLFGCSKVHFGLETKSVEIDSVYCFYLKDFEGVYSPFGLFYSSLKIVFTPRLVFKNFLDHRKDIVKSRPLKTFES